MSISEWYKHLYRPRFPIILHLVNKYQPLEAKCWYGRTKNEICVHQYHTTEEIPILCLLKVRVLFHPIVKCIKHNHISKLYGYKNDKEKLILGKHDKILNLFRWWICPAFKEDYNSINIRKYFALRYCFSDALLGDLIDYVVKQRKSPVDWCAQKISQYAEYARNIWIANGDKYERLNKEELMADINSFFGVDTIKKIVTEIGIYLLYLLVFYCICLYFIILPCILFYLLVFYYHYIIYIYIQELVILNNVMLEQTIYYIEIIGYHNYILMVHIKH